VEGTTGATLEGVQIQEIKQTMDNRIVKEINGDSMGHVAALQQSFTQRARQWSTHLRSGTQHCCTT